MFNICYDSIGKTIPIKLIDTIKKLLMAKTRQNKKNKRLTNENKIKIVSLYSMLISNMDIIQGDISSLIEIKWIRNFIGSLGQ